MAAAVESGSVARYAWFGVGALLIHGAAALALPAPPEQISAIPVAFSLVLQDVEPIRALQPGGESVAPLGAAMGVPPRSTAPTRRALTQAVARRDRATADNDVAASKPHAAPAPESADALQPSTSGEAVSSSPALSTLENAGAPGAGAGAFGARTVVGAGQGAGPGDAGTGSGNVGRGPALLALENPCSAFFPSQAHVDRGEVQIDVEVDASGHAHASSVLLELPLGQGFANAARECALKLQFAPAISQSGAPTVGHAKLKLRFKRRTA